MLSTCLNSSSKPSRFIMIKVSSTYLNQNSGVRKHIEIALVSNESMNKFAAIGEISDPMNTPYVCPYKSPRKLKTIECKHRSNALIMSEELNGQR
ncbi:unnamed protein product [Schistosoma mattheei]|uniref:Uncharacterized protein n=1 Tax=Schistosoma mattheei TaxID=31246 RepID=A0A183NNH4_9TREM|nr:unnamed protein product [Schistosoma mattheei]